MGLCWDEEEEEAETEERVVGGFGQRLNLTRPGLPDSIHHCSLFSAVVVVLLLLLFSAFGSFRVRYGVCFWGVEDKGRSGTGGTTGFSMFYDVAGDG